MDEPIPWSKQLRGRLAVGIRYGLTQPVSRRLPLSTLRQYHRLRRRMVPTRYTDANPCSLRWIDPTRITESLLESAPTYPQWGRVVDGTWDREANLFSDRPVVRALKQRFEKGTPWEQTPLTEAYAEQLERFGNAWEHNSWGGFERRCAKIDALYDSLCEQGYHRAGDREPQLTDSVASLIAEINVDIGRNGEFLWRGYGQHRLAIAQLLAIESVPVVINRRHRQWQAVRDRLRTSDHAAQPAPELREHPDLRELQECFSEQR